MYVASQQNLRSGPTILMLYKFHIFERLFKKCERVLWERVQTFRRTVINRLQNIDSVPELGCSASHVFRVYL